MKVIAKFKTVQVTYPDGDVVDVKCKTLKDALVFSARLVKVFPYRERSRIDKSYLIDFYNYLKSKGYIETELFNSNMKLLMKADLVRQLSKRWM